MKKFILILFMAYFITLPTLANEIKYQTDCGIFTFDDTTGCIIKYEGAYSIVTIPNNINSIPVTKIAFGAFQENINIKTIIIPSTIIEIRSQAFHDCSNLISVYFKGNAPTIGDHIFFGVNKSYKTYTSQNAIGFSSGIWAAMPIEVTSLNTYKMNTTVNSENLYVSVANTPFIERASLICNIYNENRLIKTMFGAINTNANTYIFDLSGCQKPFTTKLILLDSFNNIKPLAYCASNIIN